jgi:hypothetical protein
MDRHLLVIMDNMMNLDLLYEAAELSGDKTYAEMATRHAEATARDHIRDDGSTYHVVAYDPNTGGILRKFAAQGERRLWCHGGRLLDPDR